MQFTGLQTALGVYIFTPATYDPIKNAPRSRRRVGERREMRTLRVVETPSNSTFSTLA